MEERVHDERVAVLGASGAQQVGALAVEEDDRPQVEVELHVDPLGLHVGHRRADPDAGAVDEHVEPAETLAVAGHDALDVLLGGEVGGHLLDLIALPAELLDGAGELLGAARGDGEPMARLAQHLGDREPDPARGSGDEGGTVWHRSDVLSVGDPLSNQGNGCHALTVDAAV
jgi:hypothetical protein